ncbi:hypothetical protein [Arthrobacter sp. SLBN-112]|uniref:hypothetical protein n=1 Tax=Arthrobacter sp. SLBN-112 TaxID=2768452 RepID=UPI0027AF807C|nr:hypothetical protein [Arthrobacter sp. SLBN-112]MDQ0802209.1 hypothetical protein [Arthrobacter sp. SLBN-112]
MKFTDESSGTSCNAAGAAEHAGTGNPPASQEQLPAAPATHRRPVPAPPRTRLTAIDVRPSKTRNREHEVRRLIQDLAVLAERQCQQ